MDIKHLEKNLKRRKKKKNIVYRIGEPATNQDIYNVEKKLAVKFPEQIKIFYRNCGSLSIEMPPLKILPLNELNKKTNKIHFAVVDKVHKLSFDTEKFNQAGQWNIINEKSGYIVTLTFASFWSNKIWAWIDNKRKIWEDESYIFNGSCLCPSQKLIPAEITSKSSRSER